MDRGFAVLIMAVVGGAIALQAPINAGLGKSTGSFAAATVSFAIGTLLLGAIVALSGKAGGIGLLQSEIGGEERENERGRGKRAGQPEKRSDPLHRMAPCLKAHRKG